MEVDAPALVAVGSSSHCWGTTNKNGLICDYLVRRAGDARRPWRNAQEHKPV